MSTSVSELSLTDEIANYPPVDRAYELKELLTKQVETARVDGAVEVINPPQVKQGTAKNERANVIPESIRSCWNLLRKSHFGSSTFQQIVSAASNRTSRSDDGLGPLHANSLAAFLKFWAGIPYQAAEPEISINPKGNFQAEWAKNNENFLVLEFQPNGDIFFSLWQDDYPIEGIKSARRSRELESMFGVIDDNPLCWSDAT